MAQLHTESLSLRPNNAERNPQADILSDRRLFYLFNTMNLFVLRALARTHERTFSYIFCCFFFLFLCALIFLLLVFTTTCWTTDSSLFLFHSSLKTHAYKNSWTKRNLYGRKMYMKRRMCEGGVKQKVEDVVIILNWQQNIFMFAAFFSRANKCKEVWR